MQRGENVSSHVLFAPYCTITITSNNLLVIYIITHLYYIQQGHTVKISTRWMRRNYIILIFLFI